jgi:putative ABC transport system permease protein
VADLLRETDTVGTVVELRQSGARIEGEDASVAGLDPVGLEDVIDLGVAEGSLDLGPGRMLMDATEAERLGIEVGDEVTLTFPETGDTVLTVTAMLDTGLSSLVGSPYVVSLQDFSANVTSPLDASILVTAAEGADLGATQELLTQTLVDYPNVRISDPDELTAAAQGSMDQVFGLVTALLLLAVVVAVLGIVNTLVLSVLERTRELGLMRAVGATRRQVRSVVRRESVIMAVLGAVSGIVLGTLSGVALSRAMSSQGITVVAVPTSQLIVYVLVAALVGVVAAIGPAHRASNVDVLRAVMAD